MNIEDLDYAVGAISIPGIEPEIGVTKLKPNKTLLVASLLDEGPDEPEIVPDEFTSSVTKLFEYAKPAVTVELETGDEENPSEEVNLSFKKIKDFRIDEVVKKVNVLQQLSLKEEIIGKLTAQIAKSKKLQGVLNDPEKKEALLDLLLSVRSELS